MPKNAQTTTQLHSSHTKAMAPHSSTLAWKNPMGGGAWWAAVYGVTQSQKRLKQLSSSSSCFSGEGNGNPLQYSCLENPMDRGAWKASVHRVAEGQTQLSNFTFTFTFMRWRRKWQLMPVLLSGKFHVQRSLGG